MVLKRRAPASRWASAAVSSGSTATGAAWGWRERNVKVRSSATAASTSSTTRRATRLFFIARESGATALARQGARSDDPSITLPCMITSFAYGDVRYFRMARTVLGRAIYWTGVYLVDELLVDSGPPDLAHATDHVALFEAERGWLFSGDLYLAPRLRYLRADEDVYAMMDSLRRVLALEPQVLFCQHRGRVEQGAARLRDKLDFLVQLAGRIHDLHGRGWSDGAIARALPGRDLLWRGWTGGDFSKRNFVRAVLRNITAR